MYAEARAMVSLDRPINYQNVAPHRLAEIKNEVFSRIKTVRQTYYQTLEEDPRPGQLKAKFTRLLVNIKLLRALNRWKYIARERLGEKLKAYCDQIKGIFHKKAIESAQRAVTARQNLLTARKYRHDAIKHEHIVTFNCIDRVEEELRDLRKECFATIRQRARERRAKTARPMVK